jgi:hypothetical protein
LQQPFEVALGDALGILEAQMRRHLVKNLVSVLVEIGLQRQ